MKQFTAERLEGLSELNGALVYEQIERLGLSRVTVDMDGTVVQAGNQVAWGVSRVQSSSQEEQELTQTLGQQ